jgi:hypothetical protein
MLHRNVGTAAPIALLGLAFALVSSLAPASGAAAPQDAATKPAESAPAADPLEEKAKVEKERRDIVRKQTRGQRDLQMADLKLAKAKVQIELTEKQNTQAVEKAKKDIEVAERKLKNFKEKSRPERIERAELGLAFGQDSVKEAEQELEQLEIMYKDDQFADKTKEIVLERGRRRLERTKKSLAIESGAIALLKNETLPLEELEQELALKDKREAFEKMQRDQELGMIDQRVGLIAAEGEVLRLKDDISDAERDLTEFDRKQAEKAAKAATQAATTQPSR